MTKTIKKLSVASKNKKQKDPYGIFKDSIISEKDIDEVTSMWDKAVDKIDELERRED